MRSDKKPPASEKASGKKPPASVVGEDKLFARVRDIIEQQFRVDTEQITLSADFVDDLGADSLDTVELVMAFEEAFNIEIRDEDAEKVRTVQDAVEYLRGRKVTVK